MMRNQTTQQVMSILRGTKAEDRLYDHYGSESTTYTAGKSLAKA